MIFLNFMKKIPIEALKYFHFIPKLKIFSKALTEVSSGRSE